MSGYLRFRRTLRVAPGIRLNLSKSGLSTSFGPRGLHYTVGHGRRRTTVGIPGTGVFYTSYSQAHARAAGRPRHSRPVAASPPPSGVTAANGTGSLATLTPPERIAWGIVLTLLVVTSPWGLWLLVTGLLRLRDPVWRMRTYVRQAGREPANAAALLAEAATIDPHSPEVLGPLAELRLRQGDAAAALPIYREYCERVPGDWVARAHLAAAALQCNLVDEAIATFTAVLGGAPLATDERASVTAHLAYAYLCKEDPEQALELLRGTRLGRARPGPGVEQCLFHQAVCEYLLGRTAAAIHDLDRLYAMNLSFPGTQQAKAAMFDGTYRLLLPDGSALAPVHPGHAVRSGPKVVRAESPA